MEDLSVEQNLQNGITFDEEQDPGLYPHQSDESDPDPDTHKNEKSDPDLPQSEKIRNTADRAHAHHLQDVR